MPILVLLLLSTSLLALPLFPYSDAVPVIYSTDLFHPPDDPDDHVDLATLFALPELEIKAVILDLGQQQRKGPGTVPLRQMMHITSRSVPYANGLAHPLRSPDDTGEDQFRHLQGVWN